MKKILGVFAHPDDETFGPGATLAKYAAAGATVDIIMATRGEGGENNLIQKTNEPLGKIRERELRNADKILGVNQIDFLDYVDGELRQSIYFDIAKKIIAKIEIFKPDVIITFEPRGVSGHLDHIALSFITTYAYLKTNIAKKLYYSCISDTARNQRGHEYFIYFPDGYSDKEITTRIDVGSSWETKKRAMHEHKTQIIDVTRIVKNMEQMPKVDNFILKYHRLSSLKLPETDLFNGL